MKIPKSRTLHGFIITMEALHLYKAAHSVYPSALSEALYLRFIQTSESSGINIPPQVRTSHACPNCSMIWIPGWSVSVRIKFEGSKRLQSKRNKETGGRVEGADGVNDGDSVNIPSKARRNRFLVHDCLHCGESVKTLLPKPSHERHDTDVNVTTGPSVNTGFDNTNTITRTNTSGSLGGPGTNASARSVASSKSSDVFPVDSSADKVEVKSKKTKSRTKVSLRHLVAKKQKPSLDMSDFFK